jgi:predicted DNA-binding transcriptional regulator YafY
MDAKEKGRLLQMLAKAMRLEDRWVVRLTYRDAHGVRTRRFISPIRFLPAEQVLVLCLGREEPRTLDIAGMSSPELVPADQVLMPMPIELLENDDARLAIGQ